MFYKKFFVVLMVSIVSFVLISCMPASPQNYPNNDPIVSAKIENYGVQKYVDWDNNIVCYYVQSNSKNSIDIDCLKLDN